VLFSDEVRFGWNDEGRLDIKRELVVNMHQNIFAILENHAVKVVNGFIVLRLLVGISNHLSISEALETKSALEEVIQAVKRWLHKK
jgi:hypothetical protein